jgi:YfiH family protein
MSDWIIPGWPAPASVAALSTTRLGGVSKGPWQSLNLGLNSGDSTADVLHNRALLTEVLPAAPHWLQQVHGNRVVQHPGGRTDSATASASQADAQWSNESGAVCAVLAADCLPVLFCNRSGNQVAAAHAGWRGMAAGVLENTVASLHGPASELMAWMGPAIGPAVYQVGAEVVAAFAEQQAEGANAFQPDGDRWLFDLYAMARHRLLRAGVGHISGGDFCTYSDAQRFFSYRRDGQTGRMANLVWLM